MTPKLKDLKGSPLLSAPPAESLPTWLRVTDEDARLFKAEVGLRGVNEDGEGLASMYFHMKGLGLDETAPQAHELKMMKTALGKARLRRRGWRLADLLYHMIGIGVVSSVTGLDGKLMSEHFRNARGENDGHYLGLIHYYMRGVGAGEAATKDDTAKMLKGLEASRKSSMDIAQMHCFLRSAGLSAEVTGDDVRKIRERVRHYRNIQAPYKLAETLYFARILLGPAGGDGAPQVPPLKEYGG